MTGRALQSIERIDAALLKTADQFRAAPKLPPGGFAALVSGVIFLRNARATCSNTPTDTSVRAIYGAATVARPLLLRLGFDGRTKPLLKQVRNLRGANTWVEQARDATHA
ncbi:hypothetical protein BMS3Abin12_00005 [bacterium BMS3Abin12]|nr:hypothetical protein BMS3Abin12_00005 [bacterium BMS3Abin12]